MNIQTLATPETQFFWDGLADDRLLIQRCVDCGRYRFPPRPFCPYCASESMETVEACGEARLLSYVISHLALPGFEPPYVIAIVELKEGVQMVCNIVDCPLTPITLELDMVVRFTARKNGEGISLAQFKPAEV